jgi:predicted ribosome quality control (RQC) complex YloA/Tae2 family protein
MKNPDAPPMFCMLLRKHLNSGRIREVIQYSLERILEFRIEATDELGDTVTRRLIIELMGKHSNIILTNEQGVIIDSIRRVTEEISRVREVLPGLTYCPPPTQDKLNFIDMTCTELQTALDNQVGFAVSLIQKNFMGISTASAQEICFRAFKETDKYIETPEHKDALIQALSELASGIKSNNFCPYMLVDEEKPLDIYPFNFTYAGTPIKQESFSMMLDCFYEIRERIRLRNEAARDMRTKLTTLISKHKRKLSLQNESLSECANADSFRNLGDCIMTNIYLLKKGMDSAVLTDYSIDPPSEITIRLDPQLTPADNAQRYYKKYNKLKRSRDMITQQINETNEEISYLEGQLDNIENCTDLVELDEIRSELARFGYVARQQKRDKKQEPSRPLHFKSRNGIDIYVGKNNTQNDLLTASAATENMWLHVKDIHGSHVIIRKKGELPSETLYDAAMLAAYYSKAKNSSNVPVDYTLKKFVKKPSGAKPGMVIYTNNKTLYVTPDADHIRLLKIEN